MLQSVEKKTAVNSHFTDKKQEIPNTTQGIGQVLYIQWENIYELVLFLNDTHLCTCTT